MISSRETSACTVPSLAVDASEVAAIAVVLPALPLSAALGGLFGVIGWVRGCCCLGGGLVILLCNGGRVGCSGDLLL